MRRIPAIIFVVDTIKEHIAIAEGRRLRIPIGAIVDTNCDPDIVDYPIPGNDDAIKSVQLITRAVSDAILSVGDKVTVDEMVAAEEPVREGDESVPVEEGEEGDIEEQPAEDTTVRKRRVVHKKVVRITEDE